MFFESIESIESMESMATLRKGKLRTEGKGAMSRATLMQVVA